MDALDNQGLAEQKNSAEYNKEIAAEILKVTLEMNKQSKPKENSHWKTKEGYQQVKRILTDETIKNLKN